MAVKYVLTFDFRIIYCKNINLKIGFKELSFKDLNFIPYNEDVSIMDNGYEVSTNDVQYIINTVFNSKMGYEIDPLNMVWLQKFEDTIIKNPSILGNTRLTFNYLVLKLLTIGFSEDMSIDIVRKYYELTMEDADIPNVITFIKRIDSFAQQKEFWISNDIYKHQKMEIKFLKRVLDAKNSGKFNFDFADFKDEYFRLCYESFVMNNLRYNSQQSYLVTNPKSISEQKEFLLHYYSSTIGMLLNYLLQNDYESFATEDRFINSLVDEMIKVVTTFLNILEEEQNKKLK